MDPAHHPRPVQEQAPLQPVPGIGGGNYHQYPGGKAAAAGACRPGQKIALPEKPRALRISSDGHRQITRTRHVVDCGLGKQVYSGNVQTQTRQSRLKMKVHFTPALKQFVPDLQSIEVRGATVADVIRNVEAVYPGLTDYLIEENGALRKPAVYACGFVQGNPD
jgi:hypothetical protein